jgi:hypothetical protein
MFWRDLLKFWIFMLMLSLHVRNWCICWVNMPESDAYARQTCINLMRLLSIRIKFWRVWPAYTSNFDVYAQRMHSILMCMHLFGLERANKYRKRVWHAAKGKANRRTKEKDPEGGSRDQNTWQLVFAHVPPSSDLIRVPQRPVDAYILSTPIFCRHRGFCHLLYLLNFC